MKEKTFERELPEGYREVAHVNALDKRLGIILNLFSLIIAAIVLSVAAGVFALLGGEGQIFTFNGKSDILTLYLLCAALIVYLILHELVHGVVYKIMTGEKLTFGISWSCAFCGVPNIYTYTKTAIYASSAPLIVFSILFLALTVAAFFISPLLYFAAAALLAIHLGGCSGDIYILFKISKYKSERLLVRDTGPEQFFYLPGDPQDKQ
jgi:hypothetical protein